MKFIVSSTELVQRLMACSRAISPKSTAAIPVLGSILFSLEGKKLTITASDSANRVTTSLEVENRAEDGAFLMAERLVTDSLKELADQPIEFEINLESMDAKIVYSNGHYNFKVEKAEVYPLAPAMESDVQYITLPASRLLAGLNATQNATSKDERRPIMTGVFADFFEDKVVFVASDGHILVKYTDTMVHSGIRTSISISEKACTLLTKTLLPREDGEVKIAFDTKYAIFQLSEYTMTARLLEGRYPNYDSVIPTNNPFVITIERMQFLSAVKRVSGFSNQANGLVRLEVMPEQIKMTANDVDFSIAAEERIPCSGNSPDVNVHIGFDSGMLLTMLQNIAGSEINLCLADQTRAGLIYPTETQEGIDLCGLIIPMKLIGE